jgi:hypothetical protein
MNYLEAREVLAMLETGGYQLQTARLVLLPPRTDALGIKNQRAELMLVFEKVV